ncbi:hypothetical protein ACO0SA_000206 [Hanseniaspora valbyensis]
MGKNVVLCFDGTNQSFGVGPVSNVLKIYKFLDNSDVTKQVCYYQPGIGKTMGLDEGIIRKYGKNYNILNNFKNEIYKIVDSIFAISLDNHIIAAYEFLMKNYEKGDLLFMIGFSRGALLCRILSGFLERVGLLATGNEHLIGDAWTLYQGWELLEHPIEEQNEQATLLQDFQKTFSMPFKVNIQFLGLFDTVNSSGILKDRVFPFSARSGIVKHVRHALSVDERRARYKQHNFLPNPCKKGNNSESTSEYNTFVNFNSYLVERVPIKVKHLSTHKNLLYKRNKFIDHTVFFNRLCLPVLEKSKLFAEYKSSISVSLHLISVEGNFKVNSLTNDNVNLDTTLEESFDFLENQSTSDLVEKWFPGDHSDVGGGWYLDATISDEFQLSNIPLRWIIFESLKHGIIFKKHKLKKYVQNIPVEKCILSHQHDSLSFKNVALKRKTKPLHNQIIRTKEAKNNKKDRKTEEIKILENIISKKQSTRNRIDNILNENENNNTKIQKLRKLEKLPIARDSVFLKIFWWIIEFIPTTFRIQNLKKMRWKIKSKPNFGGSRSIPVYSNLHWSVIWRMKFIEEYRPSNINNSFKWILEKEANIKFPQKNNRKGDGNKHEPLLPVYLGTEISSYNRPRKSPLTSPYVSYPTYKEHFSTNLTCLCENNNRNIPNETTIVTDERSNTINSFIQMSNCIYMDIGGNKLKHLDNIDDLNNIAKCNFDTFVIKEVDFVEKNLTQNLRNWEKNNWQYIPDELKAYLEEEE